MINKQNIPIESADQFNYPTLYVDFNVEPYKNLLINSQDGEIVVLSVEQAIKLAKLILEEATDTDVATTYEDAMAKLETDKRGAYLPSAKNLGLIMKYDPNLKGLIARDLFKERRVVTRIPLWRAKDSSLDFQDVDYSGVRKHIEDVYGISNSAKIDDAIALS